MIMIMLQTQVIINSYFPQRFYRKKNKTKRTQSFHKEAYTQLNQLKSAAENKTGTKLRITKNKFQDREFSHYLFLRPSQITKARNTFVNKMSTNITIS